VLAVEPGHAEARQGVDEVQTAWARRWFSTAQHLEEEGKLGNALLAYVRADQERVGATAARERPRPCAASYATRWPSSC
jgi:hypothetical protein